MTRSSAVSVALALALAAGGCATAEVSGTGGPDARRIDARTPDGAVTDGPATDGAALDARAIDARAIDGAVIDARPIDAAIPIDAATAIDAACTPVVMQRLVNPAFDASPLGTGWVETLIDPAYPLITPDDGVPEHTAPNKAWMGGLLSGDDELRQDVAIPAGTTRLLLRGVYDLRTDEFFPGVYDNATVALTTPGNVLLETVLAIDDDGATSAWTPFQRIFAQTYAGQTVRVRIRSHNDDSDATSFFFDTLVLEATVCQ